MIESAWLWSGYWVDVVKSQLIEGDVFKERESVLGLLVESHRTNGCWNHKVTETHKPFSCAVMVQQRHSVFSREGSGITVGETMVLVVLVAWARMATGKFWMQHFTICLMLLEVCWITHVVLSLIHI